MELGEFSEALSDEGFEVVDVMKDRPDAKAKGAVSIETNIEIEGEEFDGEIMYKVFDDGLKSKGADIWQSAAGIEEDSEREALLNRVSDIRDEDTQGAIWTYYQKEDVSDNLDEIHEEVNSVFQELG